MELHKTAVTARNLAMLGNLSPRTLQNAQLNHPDHRYLSDEGKPFPCPANGTMRMYPDIEFRKTTLEDIPEGMVAPRRRNNPKPKQNRLLGRSKWDFAYMASGESLAIRIDAPKGTPEYDAEYKRIREIGMKMMRYQKKRKYIAESFLIQTHPEDIVIAKLSNGMEVEAPHITFWRIDGTHLDPEYQGN